jgi:hypothetical protein
VPRKTARKVEPKAMISELTKRGRKFDGPAITMLRLRVTSSQVPPAGSEAMISGVCRVRVVNRLQ